LAQIILGGERIQVCSNKGWCPSLRGDNSKRVKIHKKYLKIFFFRTTGPISTRLGTNHSWGEGIEVFFQIKGGIFL
jgi:hypothetical protein